MIHLPAKHKFDPQDWGMITTLHDCPMLGFSFYGDDIWSPLICDDLTLRLWHNWGILPEPERYLDSHARAIDKLMRFKPAIAPVNEANLELAEMGVSKFSLWLEGFIPLFRSYFSHLELLTPSLSPNGAWSWIESLRDIFSGCDTLAVHYYVQDESDLEPGAAYSPEWYRGQFPNMPQRITECGGADKTDAAWRYRVYPVVLPRWRMLDYVKSLHVYVMSSEDERWREHWYDNEIVKIIKEAWVGKKKFSFRFGFKELYDHDPDIIGEATSRQYDVPGVCSFQFTEHGMFVYEEGKGCRFMEQTLPFGKAR